MTNAGFRLCVLVAAAACSTAFAQVEKSFPTKPIRVVIPQPPGGSTDITMRVFGQKVAEETGQQMVIDNRAGGGVGGVGVLKAIAQTTPDGYTLLAVTPIFTITPTLIKESGIDPLKDYIPVTQLTRYPYLVLIYPGLQVTSVRDLIALAKAQPGKINFGGGNIGSGTHLTSMWFLNDADTRGSITYVPYRGTGPALVGVMSNEVQASISSVISSGPFVKSGKLKALAISTAQRSKAFPDLPTVAEQGVKGFDAFAFEGWAAPAGTPAPIVNKLSAMAARIAKSLGDSQDGAERIGSTPAQFRQTVAAELVRWRTLVDKLGIKGISE